MEKYVVYLRVSTQQQENSGLGLDAQKRDIRNFVERNKGIVFKSFTEIETGTNKRKRPKLSEAITLCKRENCKLLVAKLDRLTRNLHFMTGLYEANVPFVCCDYIDLTREMAYILAMMAEKEARDISSRTKKALQSLKDKGVKLGSPDNLTDKSRRLSAISRGRKAFNNESNKVAGRLIITLRDENYSWNKILSKLEKIGIRNDEDKFYSKSTIRMLYDRYKRADSWEDHINLQG